MAFTGAQRVQIRKYCGYPAFGGFSRPNFGFRYFTHYGQLEFILSNLAPEEETEVINNFLPKLAELEPDIYEVRQNSDTARASVWYRNSQELQERRANYLGWRKQLCEFLGVAYGPAIEAQTSSRILV